MRMSYAETNSVPLLLAVKPFVGFSWNSVKEFLRDISRKREFRESNLNDGHTLGA
jgi:hypothetical protein